MKEDIPLEADFDSESSSNVSLQPHTENEEYGEHECMHTHNAGSKTDLDGDDLDKTVDLLSSSSSTASMAEISNCDNSCSDSSNFSDVSSSSDVSSLSDSDEDGDHLASSDEEIESHGLTEQETRALKILSCFLRNSLPASACRDILETVKNTMKDMFPNSEKLAFLDFGHILSHINSCSVQEVHYCILCNKIFPDNVEEFECSTQGCDGLRYKGPHSSQRSRGRQPRQCFVMADTKTQLINLLQTPGNVHVYYIVASR